MERAALQRGVRCRVVYDRSSLDRAVPAAHDRGADGGGRGRPRVGRGPDEARDLRPPARVDAALAPARADRGRAGGARLRAAGRAGGAVRERVAARDPGPGADLAGGRAPAAADAARLRAQGRGDRAPARRSASARSGAGSPRSPTGSARGPGCSSASRPSARAGSKRPSRRRVRTASTEGKGVEIRRHVAPPSVRPRRTLSVPVAGTPTVTVEDQEHSGLIRPSVIGLCP